MEIRLNRKYKKENYTVGLLYINGTFLCNVLEDTDRGLRQDMSLKEIAAKKVKGKTAIPAGRYEVKITYSPRFKRNLPILLDVPCYEGIRFHAGNDSRDTDGCLLSGLNKKKGMVLESRKYTSIVVSKIDRALRTERVWITID